MKTEFSILKIKCTPELIGQDILIPATEEGTEIMRKFEYADKMNCNIKYKGSHNLDRHDLWFACVKLVSDNTGKPEYIICEQCKLDCRWVRGYTYYKDKNGNERLNVITRSISFSEMSLKDADEFYRQAFNILAGYLKITTEEMTAEAKSRMQSKYISKGKKNSMKEDDEQPLNASESEKPKSIPKEPEKQSTELNQIDPNAVIRVDILKEYRAGNISKDVACMEYYHFGGDAREIDPTWVEPEY